MLSNRRISDLDIYRTGLFSIFDNTSKYGFTIKGTYFPTFSHYYCHYLAQGQTEIQKQIPKIKSCRNLYNACIYARTPENHVKYYDWVKSIQIITNGVIQKVEQNVIVRKALILTNDLQLNIYVENDTFLGIGLKKEGLNVMGIIYMFVRSKIMNQHSKNLFSHLCNNLRTLELSLKEKQKLALKIMDTIHEDSESDSDEDY